MFVHTDEVMKITISGKMIFSAVIIVLGNRRPEPERARGMEGIKAAIQHPTGLTPAGKETWRCDVTWPSSYN